MLHKYIVHNSSALSDTSPRSSLALGRFTFASSPSRLIKSFRFMPTIYIYDIFSIIHDSAHASQCTEISPVVARKKAPRTHTKPSFELFSLHTKILSGAELSHRVCFLRWNFLPSHPARARLCVCVRVSREWECVYYYGSISFSFHRYVIFNFYLSYFFVSPRWKCHRKNVQGINSNRAFIEPTVSDEVCVVSAFGARGPSLRQEAMLSAQLTTNETLSLWLGNCEVEVMNRTVLSRVVREHM